MFIANDFVAHLRQLLPILLYTMYWKESFQHTRLICIIILKYLSRIIKSYARNYLYIKSIYEVQEAA